MYKKNKFNLAFISWYVYYYNGSCLKLYIQENICNFNSSFFQFHKNLYTCI